MQGKTDPWKLDRCTRGPLSSRSRRPAPLISRVGSFVISGRDIPLRSSSRPPRPEPLARPLMKASFLQGDCRDLLQINTAVSRSGGREAERPGVSLSEPRELSDLPRRSAELRTKHAHTAAFIPRTRNFAPIPKQTNRRISLHYFAGLNRAFFHRGDPIIADSF